MISLSKDNNPPAAKEQWSVVIVCEDEPTHARALSMCKLLAGRFWTEIDFEFRWWQFAGLFDPANAPDATTAAAEADMIMVATHEDGELPEEVRSWCKAWSDRRCNREGALVALFGGPDEVEAKTGAKQLFLREVARRAQMDFLSDVTHVIPRKVPESMDWFSNRADQIGSTLDHILHLPDKPPQAGMRF